MPDSDPARQVHLGIKTGAFYGQEAISEELQVFLLFAICFFNRVEQPS
jgi:hypothetical protein